jgi:hypothetical protein
MRVRAAGIVLAAVAPWTLVACSHEDDEKAMCPDVATLYTVGAHADPHHDLDYDAVMDAIDCDGQTSEREARCLRTPWARAPDPDVFPGQVGASPEEAVRLAAAAGTVITREISRIGARARYEVELDGDIGALDVQRVRRGWMAVAGEGCASGTDDEGWRDDLIGEDCQRAIDEATPDESGDAYVTCEGPAAP